jgi:hypothetical protein
MAKKTEKVVQAKAPKAPKAKKKPAAKRAPKLDAIRVAAEKEKVAATRRGEPWVGVLSTEFDPENPSAGFFELDWNPIFVAKLLRAGYSGKNEEEIVNQWFEALCKNALADTYEEVTQMQGTTFIQRKRTEDGKTEVS